ncbi:MAG: hypothetical protein KR126chlam4_00318 [Candidatus Anoxychlamydiales bacterium]|nr:hypothetical protein [Candidatus Anoxychlamydiales bacterium]NGX40496.1 hypothetical protein [Candidatus Anoxychlamydiales bacterium]HEU64018.1 hypothetical protein [Chlamydiota bacterium]
MTVQAIRNRCSSLLNYVSNNPRKCVPDPIAALFWVPTVCCVVSWAASGIASGGSSIVEGISYIAKKLIEGDL